MASKNHTTTNTTKKLNSLEKFTLGFEYDMTWHDARKSIRSRADK